ncbi:hypothetical protein niasHT_020047 [Heterodera trifolii]|uniref:Secreted protein n=1 Tax=Heterodera trifolii TaxID=157864 RepID=A0ABD2KXB7_9BILA
MIRIFPLLLFIIVILHRFRPVASVATRLLFSNEDSSRLIIITEAKQSAIAHRDIPWTNGFSPLCANVVVVLLLHRPGTAHRHGTTMMMLTYKDAKNNNHAVNLVPIYAASSSASTLAPQRVEIYAEIGHLTQFCGAKEPFMTKRTTIDIQQLAEEFRNK